MEQGHKSYNVTLYGGAGQSEIILRTLSDSDLTLLLKWKRNFRKTSWIESGAEPLFPFTKKTIWVWFSNRVQTGLCFLIEVNGKCIGSCQIQKVKDPEVIAMYAQGSDIRKLEILVRAARQRKQDYLGLVVQMLVDYAFNGEQADVLHCVSLQYDEKNPNLWQQHGFQLVSVKEIPERGLQYHFSLTKEVFLSKKRRHSVAQDDVFYLPIEQLQPSQLYISEGKLRVASQWFEGLPASQMDPIPVISCQGRTVMTDGHTRAVLAHLNQWKELPCYQDTDRLEMDLYAERLRRCMAEGVTCIGDLASRVIPHKEYNRLWRE